MVTGNGSIFFCSSLEGDETILMLLCLKTMPIFLLCREQVASNSGPLQAWSALALACHTFLGLPFTLRHDGISCLSAFLLTLLISLHPLFLSPRSLIALVTANYDQVAPSDFPRSPPAGSQLRVNLVLRPHCQKRNCPKPTLSVVTSPERGQPPDDWIGDIHCGASRVHP